MRAPCRFNVLHVGIVNDHHDVVPFIHSLLRRKSIKQGLLCIHFDSHADLCIPSAETKENSVLNWKFPRSLYYDVFGYSEAAISEFLIPLMYNQDIGPLIWVKSQMASSSIDDGVYDCLVGDRPVKRKGWSLPAIDLPIPYYLDEGTATKQDSLNHARPVRFQVVSGADGLVKELPTVKSLSSPESRRSREHNVPWMLDICLDFFSVINPFHDAIYRSLEADIAASLEQRDTQLARMASDDTDHSEWERCVPETAKEGLEIIREAYTCLAFRASLTNYQKSTSLEKGKEIRAENADLDVIRDRQMALELLRRVLVGRPRESGDDVSFAEFSPLFPREKRAMLAARRFYYGLLLPVLSMKTRNLLAQAGLCILLPHYVASEDEVQRSLSSLKDALSAITSELGPPSCVTLARSVDEKIVKETSITPPKRKRHKACVPRYGKEEVSEVIGDEDGFTPSSQVGAIQTGVLQILHAFAQPDGAWGMRLQEHHLYADSNDEEDLDAYERCYGLFLNPKAQGALEIS